MKLKIAICGYGNLGHGVERALLQAPDAEPVAIFTRRQPSTLHALGNAPILPLSALLQWKDRVDVLVLCGGSAGDLPQQTPEFAAHFNTVDSFDRHANIPAHLQAVGQAASAAGHLSLISAGWDPGLFSVARLLFQAFLPNGNCTTLWGRGVSQGHSDAVRQIPGVIDARAYTVPLANAASAIAAPPTATHRRECFVVAQPGADRARIANEIRTLPGYFQGYDTAVIFITPEKMKRDHTGLAHGGQVLCAGTTGAEPSLHRHRFSLGLQADSNPELTGNILVAYTRAVHALYRKGTRGAITPLDVPPALLSPLSPEQQRHSFL